MSNNKVNVIIKAKDEASKVLKQVGDNTDKFGKRSAGAFKKSSMGASFLKKNILGVSAVAGTALVAMGAKAVGMASKFEKAMTNVSTLIDTGVESMEKMKSEVLEIAERTPVALDDLTASLYDVRSAGIDAEQAMSVLEQSAILGTAGLGSTKDATTLMTLALNNFRDSGLKADEVANIMFKTVKGGITNIQQLSQSFGQVAPLAVDAGVSLEELQAATSALTQVNKSASISQNSIKASLVSLIKPTSAAKDLFSDLGVSTFSELIKKSGGLVEAFQSLKDASDEYGGASSEMFAGAIGSGEALSAVNALLGSQAEAYKQSLSEMRDGTDALTEAYSKQNEAFQSQFQMLRNKLDVALTKVGMIILKVLTPAVKFINDLFDENTSAGQRMAGVLNTIKNVLGVVGNVFSVVVAIIKEVWKTITDSPLGALAESLFNIGTKVVPMFVNFVRKGFNRMSDFVQKSTDRIKKFIALSWQDKLKIITVVIAGILKGVGALFKDMNQIFSNGAHNIVQLLSNTSEVLADVFDSINWEALWDNFLTATSNVLNKVWDGVKSWANSVWESITNLWNGGEAPEPDINFAPAEEKAEQASKSIKDRLTKGMKSLDFTNTVAVYQDTMNEIDSIIAKSAVHDKIEVPELDLGEDAISKMSSAVANADIKSNTKTSPSESSNKATDDMTDMKIEAEAKQTQTSINNIKAIEEADNASSQSMSANAGKQKSDMKSVSKEHKDMVDSITSANEILMNNVQTVVDKVVALYEKLKITLQNVKSITAPKEGEDPRTLQDVAKQFNITDPTSNGVFKPINEKLQINDATAGGKSREIAKAQGDTINITINSKNGESDQTMIKRMIRAIQLQKQYA